MTWLSALRRRAPAAVEPATQRDVPALAALHRASFHRGWDEGVFAAMLAERNTLLHRLRRSTAVLGFAASRMAADEAELLSIAVAVKARGQGLSRTLLETHLAHLAGRGVRTVFLEVEEHNAPACRLYSRTGFAQVGRRERYYREAGGGELNALILRRDLS